MGAIFLSYAREDRGCAEALARVLEQAGHTVWWDRRIESGTEFTGEIEEALDAADVVLVAWSKDSVKSRWVRDEAAIGGDSGRLLPVLIDGAQPPLGFRQFHALDLTGWKGGKKDPRSAELLQAIERKLKGKAKVEPASPAAQSKPRFALPAGRPLWAIAALFVLMVAVGAGYFLQRSGDKSSGPLKPTIGLLPFTTASPDAELRQLTSQSRDSIAHTFSQSGVPVRVMDSAPQGGQAEVDFLLSGDLSRNGEKVVATVRLDEAAQRVLVFSDRFEASREDLRDLPERIGAQMAGNLAWSFPLMILDRRRPIEPALMAELLQDEDFTSGFDSLKAYQNSKRVAARVPELDIAQIDVAFATGFVLDQLPRDERAKAVAEARRAADRAITLRPGFGDTYAAWCLLHSETRRAECEDRLRAGRRIDPDAPFLNTFLSQLMRNVGRFDEWIELARLAHTHDPYVPTKIGYMLRMLEYAGESDEARKLHQQGARWWPEFKDGFFRERMIGLLARGDFEAVELLEREVGPENLPASYQKSGPLVAAVKSKSPAAVRRICGVAENFMLKNVRCLLAYAKVGDLDGAYGVADELYPVRIGRTPGETERIWLDEPGAATLEFVTSPAAAPMRRDPRYLQLAQRVGLLAYWRSGRRPDFCRKQPEPICAQLLKRP